MKTFTLSIVCLSFLLHSSFLNSSSREQGDVIEQAKTAIKEGNAKTLIAYFDELVELNLENNKSSYSRRQAEFVLKDFFQKYPAKDFEYIYQGSSREGMKYAIGKYTYEGGVFRVYMLIKKTEESYFIDMLDFGKDS
jgi:hypothetical protein